MFRDPFGQLLALNAGGVSEGGEENSVPSQNFFRKFSGKALTKQNANVLFEIFPQSGERFFEIYFVRLIGTPNQHIPS